MEIVFATNNLNKIKEVQSLLPSNITILSLESIGCNEEIPETKNTIEENAIQKADYIKEHYGLNCFADDTGLEVNALNSSPGVYSARYAGPEKCSESNMKLLLFPLQLCHDWTSLPLIGQDDSLNLIGSLTSIFTIFFIYIIFML